MQPGQGFRTGGGRGSPPGALRAALRAIVLTALAAAMVVPTTAVSAAEGYPMSATVFVHDRPSTSADTRIGQVWEAERVKILCQDNGPDVNGNQVWDRIEYLIDGSTRTKQGFVADFYVSTGVTGRLPGMPSCSLETGSPAPPAPPSPPPPSSIPPNSYQFLNHWWYSELLFNKAATAQAARDTENFCDDLADIPLIGIGEKYFCRTYYIEFRRAAEQAVAENRCVRWVFGLQLIPKPDTYTGPFCS